MSRHALDRARLAFEGLSLGDAFGEQFFTGSDADKRTRFERRRVPVGHWRWTDDTAMAACIVGELVADGAIDPDRLAQSFAQRYVAEPWRGYGGGAHEVLAAIARGVPWPDAARISFADGSRGNGAAMRSAPIGAYCGLDVAAVTREATASALPTHVHPDAIDGAVAVALAAGYAAVRSGQHQPSALLAFVSANLRDGVVAAGIRRALDMVDEDPDTAAKALGAGYRVLAEDTVPFALWCADRHLMSMPDALWTTVAALGDRDTTCAIAGGIVAGAVGPDGLPEAWLSHREPLPLLRGMPGPTRIGASGPGMSHAPGLPRLDGRTRLLVLTGDGIAAGVGQATSGGSWSLWEGPQAEDAGMRGGCERDPDLAWAVYSARRAAAWAAQPNPAHHAIVDLEHLLGDRFLLVTEGVDGLHPRAGSRRGVEIFGSLWRTRCSRCDTRSVADGAPPVGPPSPRCPRCEDGVLRPDIVRVGEPLDQRLTGRVARFMRDAGASGERFVVLAVGTPGLVDPVGSWASRARAVGAETWCVTPQPPAGDTPFDHVVVGPPVEVVPAIVAQAVD